MITMAASRPTPTPQLFNLPSSPTPASPFFSPQTVRKRRAVSPPTPPSSNAAYTPSSPWAVDASPIPAKKRRPNLASGFSSLSIAPPAETPSGPSSLPSYVESQEAEHSRRKIDDDDEDNDSLEGGIPLASSDVYVEEVNTPRKRPHRPRLGHTRGSGSSSTSTNGYDSDSTFSIPALRRRGTQQADEVEQPYDSVPMEYSRDVGVEDITPRIGIKRRSSSASESGRGKRMRDGMDVDMAGDGDVQEIIRDDVRGRRRSEWHEPEKDREFSSLCDCKRVITEL